MRHVLSPSCVVSGLMVGILISMGAEGQAADSFHDVTSVGVQASRKHAAGPGAPAPEVVPPDFIRFVVWQLGLKEIRFPWPQDEDRQLVLVWPFLRKVSQILSDVVIVETSTTSLLPFRLPQDDSFFRYRSARFRSFEGKEPRVVWPRTQRDRDSKAGWAWVLEISEPLVGEYSPSLVGSPFWGMFQRVWTEDLHDCLTSLKSRVPKAASLGVVVRLSYGPVQGGCSWYWFPLGRDCGSGGCMWAYYTSDELPSAIDGFCQWVSSDGRFLLPQE